MVRLFTALLLGLTMACAPSSPEGDAGDAATTDTSATDILKAAQKVHGSHLIDGATVQFRFRDRTYTSEREAGKFRYIRAFRSEAGDSIRDILTNEGLERRINGEKVALSPKDSAAYANSVNSVLYFALLPYNLTDPAVQLKYLGRDSLLGEGYHQVQVTFQKEGGGKDFEDRFVYWFHRERKTIDFLAYSYLTDGGGARFRQAVDAVQRGGIRFQDYINFKPVPDSRKVEDFGRLFEAGKMEEVSRIELHQVEVKKPVL